jgi:hypothetical protein
VDSGERKNALGKKDLLKSKRAVMEKAPTIKIAKAFS